MSDLLQAAPASRRAQRRARWSVVLTAVGLTTAAVYLGWREGYFTPVAHFHFSAHSSKSLGKGMAVHLSGFKIGQVSNVELLADRSVEVELAIFKPYLDFIRSDCEVQLESGLPLGDASLEITGGPSRAAVAEPGSALRYRDRAQLFDQVGVVVQKLEPAIENLNALLAQARQPQGELQVALRNLADTSATLQAWVPGFTAHADATLASYKDTSASAQAFLAPLRAADGDLGVALHDLRDTTAGLRSDLPELLADLKAMSASLRASATALEPTVKELGPKLPALVDETRRTAADAGEVIDAVKDFGLIRHKIDQPATQPLLPTTPP